MPITLDPEQGSLAKEAAEVAEVLEHAENEGQRARLVDPHGHEVELPGPLIEVLTSIANQLQRGNGVVVMPAHKLLTSNQAAEILNVSRPHLIKLLDKKVIPFEYVGTHRRVRLSDLLAYQDRRNAEREASLAEIVELGEAEGLPY
jgi:excisionase family DNA binding protein